MADDFEEKLAQVLSARPGLTKGRLAEAMHLENDEEFRRELDEACDRNVAHKIQDKYYPGVRKAY